MKPCGERKEGEEESPMGFADEMRAAADAAGIALTPAQVADYETYYDLLIEWNEKMNLTALTSPHDVAVKHIIDSLLAYDARLFAGAPSVIDVGTGAGFPGLPLKIYAPDIRLTLMDALKKRVHFLETVTEALHLEGVTCVHARAEEAARDRAYRERYDIAVSRAVARLPVLLEYTLPFVRQGGTLLALKGRQYQEEVDGAARALKLLGGTLRDVRPVHLPGLDDVRAVIIVRKERPTPRAYPRKAGTPAKKPL